MYFSRPSAAVFASVLMMSDGQTLCDGAIDAPSCQNITSEVLARHDWLSEIHPPAPEYATAKKGFDEGGWKDRKILNALVAVAFKEYECNLCHNILQYQFANHSPLSFSTIEAFSTMSFAFVPPSVFWRELMAVIAMRFRPVRKAFSIASASVGADSDARRP